MQNIQKTSFSLSDFETADFSGGYDSQDSDFFAQIAGGAGNQRTEMPFSPYLSGAQHASVGETILNGSTSVNTKELSNVSSQLKDLFIKDSLVAKATSKVVQGIEKLTNLQ